MEMNTTANNTIDLKTGGNSNSLDYGSIIIGTFLTIGTVPGIAANFIVGLVMVKHKFLKDAERTIYRPMFNLLFGDTVQLLIAFIFGIACTVQRKLTGHVTWAWTARVFQLLWHNSWFMLSLIAVNRYLGTCYPGLYKRVFTARRMNALVALSWLGSSLTSGASQTLVLYFGKCCQPVHEPMIFTTTWVQQGEAVNYAEYIDGPGNYATAAVLVFCYAAVVVRIRAINKSVLMSRVDFWACPSLLVQVVSSLHRDSAERRRRQEQRFALQFLAISAAFVGSITLFRLLPLLIGFFEITTVKIFASVQVLVIFNWSLNSFIFIGFNKDIRGHIFATQDVSTASGRATPGGSRGSLKSW